MAAHFGCTVRELEARMGSDELSEWLAFDGLYGFPDVFFLAAQLCVATTSPWMPKGKSPRVEDWVPYFGVTRRQTTADHAALFRAMAEMNTCR